MENKINQDNYKQTDLYKKTQRILSDLYERHAYDTDFRKGIDIMRDAIQDRVSALLLVADFFKQDDLDLFGERTQKDRIAFFKLCEKLKNDDNTITLELRIEKDMAYFDEIKRKKKQEQEQEQENRQKEEKQQKARDAFSQRPQFDEDRKPHQNTRSRRSRSRGWGMER